MSLVADRKYYEAVSPGGISEQLLIVARDRMFKDFTARMRPTSTDRVLDVGVSDVINDGANVLERNYPHRHNITACGLSDGRNFTQAYPGAHYVRIMPNTRLPFDDNSFDIATSNAVLEHVGSFENQRLFVSELCRVAKRVFICVPNRLFPVEHHTGMPVAHYTNKSFQIACRVFGKSEWAQEKNLILMSRKLLWRLAAPIGRSTAVGYTGLLLGPFSSNLYLAIH